MKYKEGAKKLIEDSENSSKEIIRNEKSGKAKVKVQIAKLEGDIVEAEEKVENAQEAYDNSKFAIPFNLENIDNAEYKLKKEKAALESLKDDLASRNALLKELF